MRTLADWPIGLTGKTTRGDTYQIVYHDHNAVDMPVLAVLNGSMAVWAEPGGLVAVWPEPDGLASVQRLLYLIHPDDELVDIRDDLTNPGEVPVRRLTMESRQALAEAGWAQIEFKSCSGWHTSAQAYRYPPLTAAVWSADNVDGNTIYRVRPAPKLRPMDEDERREWANRQPDTVLVKLHELVGAVNVFSLMLPTDNYQWCDVQVGGGWQPLPMVEEAI